MYSISLQKFSRQSLLLVSRRRFGTSCSRFQCRRSLQISVWRNNSSACFGENCINSNLPTIGRVLFSTQTAAPAQAAASDAGGKEKNVDSSKSNNVFLDNLGSIFLAAIALIIGSLIRSHYGTQNKNHIRDLIEEQSALDPLELDDLRMTNSELSVPIFREIQADVMQAAKQKALSQGDSDLSLSYAEFVRAVRATMARQKGENFTIQLGHLMDRVVLSALERHEKSSDSEMPVTFWLTVLSLALHSPVEDRIQVLFEILQQKRLAQKLEPEGDDNLFGSDASKTDNTNGIATTKDRIPIEDVKELVLHLQDSCQLPPDAQVVKNDTKYPTQQYERGTPEQLVVWGKTKEDENAKSGMEDDDDANSIDLDAFAAILRSKSVCAWGECYNRRTSP